VPSTSDTSAPVPDQQLSDPRRLKLHPVMNNQDVCQVGTLLTLLDGSLKALTGAMTRARTPTLNLIIVLLASFLIYSRLHACQHG